MKRYYWNGISKDERIKSISEITTIVDRYAAIINFQRFSDISLSLVIEIEEYKKVGFKEEYRYWYRIKA